MKKKVAQGVSELISTVGSDDASAPSRAANLDSLALIGNLSPAHFRTKYMRHFNLIQATKLNLKRSEASNT